MNHSFDIQVATKIGMHEAILLQHIYFWYQKNRGNNHNYFDGTWWSYNSRTAFKKQFPYMKDYDIKKTLKNLETSGYIQTGNYNKKKFDKTKWYSLTEAGLILLGAQEPNSQNSINRLSNDANGLSNDANESAPVVGEIRQPIPDTNTDTSADVARAETTTNNNQDNNQDVKDEIKKATHTKGEERYNPQITEPTPGEVKQYAEFIGYPMSLKDAEKFIAKYSALGWQEKGSLIRDWRGKVTIWKMNNNRSLSVSNGYTAGTDQKSMLEKKREFFRQKGFGEEKIRRLIG